MAVDREGVVEVTASLSKQQLLLCSHRGGDLVVSAQPDSEGESEREAWFVADARIAQLVGVGGVEKRLRRAPQCLTSFRSQSTTIQQEALVCQSGCSAGASSSCFTQLGIVFRQVCTQATGIEQQSYEL